MMHRVLVEQRWQIDAPPAAVWAIVADVARWGEWTPTVRRIERIDAGEFGAGSRAKLLLRGSWVPTTWRVTSFEPGCAFTWESRIVPGAYSVADHEVAPSGSGTAVTLRVSMRGPLARVVAPLFARVSRENVQIEGDGLKAHAEAEAKVQANANE